MAEAEIVQDQWAGKELTPAQKENRAAADLIPFGSHGVSPQTFAQMVDWAKYMSLSKSVMPATLQNNIGGCLAIIDLGTKFQMSPYMLARGCYFVGGVLALDGQTTMAIMNMHMPLAKTADGKRTRLRYEFKGEKAVYRQEEVAETDRDGRPTGKKIWVSKLVTPSTRQIIVRGLMENEADVLEYESPQVQNIQNKNSPLWIEDEDQQLIYWASRRWQRRHWPEGLLGVYDKEELPEHMMRDVTPTSHQVGGALAQRIAAAQGEQTADGFDGAQVEQTINQMRGHDSVERVKSSEDATAKWDRRRKPKTVEDWHLYCSDWIDHIVSDEKMKPVERGTMMTKRWVEEAQMRADLKVPSEMDDEVRLMMIERIEKIGGFKR